MEPLDINYQLKKRFGRLVDFAAHIGVSKVSLCQVVYGVRKNPKIRQAIAQALEMPVEQVFPETPSLSA